MRRWGHGGGGRGALKRLHGRAPPRPEPLAPWRSLHNTPAVFETLILGLHEPTSGLIMMLCWERAVCGVGRGGPARGSLSLAGVLVASPALAWTPGCTSAFLCFTSVILPNFILSKESATSTVSEPAFLTTGLRDCVLGVTTMRHVPRGICAPVFVFHFSFIFCVLYTQVLYLNLLQRSWLPTLSSCFLSEAKPLVHSQTHKKNSVYCNTRVYVKEF